MSHQLTDQVKLLQKAVLRHQGQFLIMKRSEEATNRPGVWDLPGGNSEWPRVQADKANLHLDDLLREVEEETTLKLDRQSIKLPTQPIYLSTYFEADKQIFTIIVGWQIELPADFDRTSPALSQEHSDYAWISTTDFDQYDFGFAGEQVGFIRQMIRQI